MRVYRDVPVVATAAVPADPCRRSPSVVWDGFAAGG